MPELPLVPVQHAGLMGTQGSWAYALRVDRMLLLRVDRMPLGGSSCYAIVITKCHTHVCHTHEQLMPDDVRCG